MFDSPEFYLHSIHGIGTVPDLNIRVVAKGKCPTKLQCAYHTKNIVIEKSTKFATFVNAQLELIPWLHANSTIPLCFEDLGHYLATDFWI